MARLLWFILMLALAAAAVTGASWAIAYNQVGSLLGDPPPEMGTQTTTFLWNGSTPGGNAHVWSFAFYPTRIPDAPTVYIYVKPWGSVVETYPADLSARVKLLHSKGY
ncbi:MAG TPA: hypothetical protein VLT79_09520 [Gemmatimonadales bacterium]|nr:hypothetical protein [Gemmatimonadales bacterium]